VSARYPKRLPVLLDFYLYDLKLQKPFYFTLLYFTFFLKWDILKEFKRFGESCTFPAKNSRSIAIRFLSRFKTSVHSVLDLFTIEAAGSCALNRCVSDTAKGQRTAKAM
jgi:hypothetical protein